MKLSFLLLPGVALVLFGTLGSASSFNAHEIVDSLEKWKDVGVHAAHSSTSPALKTAISLIDALGKAIPHAGPLASLLSGILGFFVKSDNQIIKEKLDAMNRELKHIDAHLDEVAKGLERHVTDVTILNAYKRHIEDVRGLKYAYSRFTGNPTNQTKDDFRYLCGHEKMLTFAHWIDDELSGRSAILPLRALLIEDADVRNLDLWSGRIAQMLSDALFLHITCVGVAKESEQTIRETLNGVRGGTGDIALFRGILRNVHRGLNQARKTIKKQFFRHAREEVGKFLAAHEGADHQAFAKNLQVQLSRKYPWRVWFVASWMTAGYDHHTISSANRNSWYWHRVHGRCLLVGSVLPHGNSHLAAQVTKCIESSHQRKVDHGSLAKNVHDDAHSCIKTHLDTLAVIEFGSGLRGHFAAGYGFFTNGWYGKGARAEVSLLAIAHDPTVDAEGEICQMTDDNKYRFAKVGESCCAKDATRQCPDDETCPNCN